VGNSTKQGESHHGGKKFFQKGGNKFKGPKKKGKGKFPVCEETIRKGERARLWERGLFLPVNATTKIGEGPRGPRTNTNYSNEKNSAKMDRGKKTVKGKGGCSCLLFAGQRGKDFYEAH